MYWHKIQIVIGLSRRKEGETFRLIVRVILIDLSRPRGNWTIFTGDQLGSLFADRILQSYKSIGHPMENLAMVASTVSSKMLGAMAKAEGFRFVECLTGMLSIWFTYSYSLLFSQGFKFIGNTALDLVKEGFEVPFGYEEAIGFMFGPDIRDKDGIAAMVKIIQSSGSMLKQQLKIFRCHSRRLLCLFVLMGRLLMSVFKNYIRS